MSPIRTGIDLHTHSTASDGTALPDELVRQASAAGLTVLALTDHDTFAGIDAAAAALPVGAMLVPGVEISCVALEGERRIGLHLLGYLPDRVDGPLVEALDRMRQARAQRAVRVVEALRADGYEQVTHELVAEMAAGAPVGRPHLASALVQVGLAKDFDEAFGPAWLGPGARYRVPKQDLPVLEAVALVRAAGGVPVFAHPGAHRRGPTVSDETVAAMVGAGLLGLEVDHTDHDPATRAHLTGLAADLDLVTTGSSDFHGTRKPVRLGDESTSPAALERLLSLSPHQPLVA